MELRQTAENSAKVIQRTKDSMAFYLQVLAGEAELAFSKKNAESPKIYVAADFDDPRTAPEDFLPVQRFRIKTHDGEFLDNPVSFNQPVFLLPPDLEKEKSASDLAFLSQMIPTFRKLSGEFGKTLHWAHICLKNGIFMSYPGHGGYLDSFEPRRYPWFAGAKDSPTWTLPRINTNTGFLTFTVSKRLYRPDGSFLGVAAIDIRFTEALQKSALSPLWASDAHSFKWAVSAVGIRCPFLYCDHGPRSADGSIRTFSCGPQGLSTRSRILGAGGRKRMALFHRKCRI
jgi:sigma-B regulation protein RsbU (phosphoserine phosphatase)